MWRIEDARLNFWERTPLSEWKIRLNWASVQTKLYQAWQRIASTSPRAIQSSRRIGQSKLLKSKIVTISICVLTRPCKRSNLSRNLWPKKVPKKMRTRTKKSLIRLKNSRGTRSFKWLIKAAIVPQKCSKSIKWELHMACRQLWTHNGLPRDKKQAQYEYVLVFSHLRSRQK